MTRQRLIGEMRRALTEDVGLDEVRSVTTFKAYRGDDRVVVEIEDSGPDCDPSLRYRCFAKTEGGRVATGNPVESPVMAILTTHWNKLDG